MSNAVYTLTDLLKIHNLHQRKIEIAIRGLDVFLCRTIPLTQSYTGLMSEQLIPITVLTGFLGAGKTTILNTIFQAIDSEFVILIKNEFGSVKVDSQLSKVQTFEFTNGCLCCVLVGQLQESLLQAMELHPSRIFVETSGSAFPAGIALQIKQISGLFLDAIITVIDCQNFMGYEDTSYTAKLQAKYTDIILLNKHELVSPRELDIVIDHLNELNTDTPKFLWDPSNVPVLVGFQRTWQFGTEDQETEHHSKEIDTIHIQASEYSTNLKDLEEFLNKLDNDVYRLKGFIHLQDQRYIINWAFKRYTLTKHDDSRELLLTVMGLDLATCNLNICNLEFGNLNVQLKSADR